MNPYASGLYLKSDAEITALRAQKDELNKQARENWFDDKWRKEMAGVMTEVIYRGFEHENLLSFMTDLENVAWDDRVLVKEVRGLKAYWLARGSYIQASTMRENVIELPRAVVGIHVTELEDKILSNFAETQANFIDLAIQRLDAAVNLRFLKLLQAALPTSTSPFVIQASGLSLTALNSALTAVRDESRNMQVVIVGRSTMTDLIMNGVTGNGTNTDFLLETNEEIMRQGVLGTYRGAKVLSLKNFKDDNEVPFFPANELYVIATDASKCGFFGGLRPREWIEDEGENWHYLVKREFGGLVHRPQRLRRIIDTSQQPFATFPND